MTRIVWGMSLALLMTFLLSAEARSQDSKAIDRAIEQGVKYLRTMQRKDGRWPLPAIGATALAGLTLLECGVPADDPAVRKAARAVREEVPGLQVTYSLAVAVLFLDRLGESADKPLIEVMGVRLLAGQNSAGGWSYGCTYVADAELSRLKVLFKQRTALVARGEGAKRPARPVTLDPSPEIQRVLARIASRQVDAPDDNSNTQFAILGLWAARRHGVPVDMALGRVKARFRSSQNANGGWGYSAHYGPDLTESSYTMTCAGLLGLACAYGSYAESRLAREKASADAEAKEQPRIDPVFDGPIRKGLLGLGTVVGRRVGQVGPPDPPVGGYRMAAGVDARGRVGHEFAYYFLWSLERVAVAYGLKTIGNKDWYAWGAKALLATQRPDGSWRGACALGGCDTCFALLFLRRANLTKDLSAQLQGLIKDPGESVLRAGGFGGEKLAQRPTPPKVAGKDGEYGGKLKPATGPPVPRTPEETAPSKAAEPANRAARAPTAQVPADDEAGRLSRQFLQAPVAVQKTMLVQFRDARGPAYTAALARVIPQLGREIRSQARDALAERLTRMTAATLAEKLRDDSAEIRRAAVVACAMKQEKSQFLRLVDLLDDSEPAVVRSAHAALKSLSGQEFGPTNASPAERARAAAAWRAWWQKQGSR